MNYAYPLDSDLVNGEYDRAINSADYRKIRKLQLSTGIYNGLNVIASDGMSVVVKTGACEIEGATRQFEEDTTLVLQASDTHYARKDCVVCRLDLTHAVRNIQLYVLQGTASASPVAPTLTRTSSIYEIALAEILVPVNSTSVSQARITDTRLDTEKCGLVHAINSFDSDDLYNQISADMEEFKSKEQTEFTSWFDTLKNTLDENTATKLLNMINEIPLKMYPVGSIYTSLDSTNPGTFLGGTWKAIAQGSTLIGADNTYKANTTYGENSHSLTTDEMPKHRHAVLDNGEKFVGQTGGVAPTNSIGMATSSGRNSTFYTDYQGNGDSFSIMQQSLAVYIWKRTA